MSIATLSLLTLVACPTAFPTRDFPDNPAHDFDGDGVTEEQGDCDDTRTDVAPGLPELCDARDNDCNSLADDSPVDPTVWYRDSDGDLYGDATVATTACSAPAGFVAEGGDCDDTKSLVHPGVNETCTDFDDNCDGDLQVPEGTDAPLWYLDRDGDNFGDPASPSAPSCEPPSGYVYDATDCDDRNASVRPRGVEVCDGADNDCDTLTDDADADASGQASWYADGDGDGWGANEDAVPACAAPDGRVSQAGDCDDTHADVSPGASETCDGLDQDCDGRVDDGVTTQFHVDLDGDGYGDPDGASVDACAAPSGFADDATDCDDSDPDAHPDAAEVCDGADNDCDSRTDESGALGAATWYADADGDGYGDRATTFAACTAPPSYVSTTGDCDDGRADVNPDARESCLTAFDDDCDGSDNDPGAVGCLDFWNDADGDGYGNASGAASCQCRADATTLFTARDDDDCDDANARVNPDELEDCTTRDDDDCSGTTNDDGAAYCSYFFVDVDGDGYGDDALHDDAACTCEGEGYLTATVEGDCLDTDARVSPAATEVCGGGDEDCSGSVDDDAVDATTWYRDSDTDTYGNASVSRVACTAPSGYVARAADCDDARDAVNPGQAETCLTLFDDDCSGSTNDRGSVACTTFYADADSDGYGVSTDSVCTCSADLTTAYTSRVTGDCVDTNAGVSPGDTELCSTVGVDDDCDGTADEANASGCTNYFYDYDGDGYGTATSQCLCAPTGYYTAATLGDCNDSDSTMNPRAMNCGLLGTVSTSSAAAVITGREYPTWDGSRTISDYAALDSVQSLDYNRDGVNDVVVGDPWESHSYRQSGTLYLWLGPIVGAHRASSTGDADLVFIADALDRRLGARISAGDVDGDGYDEIAVSGYGSGESYVIDDGLSGLGEITPTTAGVTTLSMTSGYSAAAFSIVGDLDGDNYADAVDYSNLYYGSPTGLLTRPRDSLPGCLGHNCSSGDVDGDGAEDFIQGVWTGSSTQLRVYQGGSGIWDVVYDTSFDLGYDVFYQTRFGGDLNGDGYGDVLYSRFTANGRTNPYTGASPYESGRLYIFSGGESGGEPSILRPGGTPASSPSDFVWQVEGEITNQLLAFSSANVSDIDADGFEDLSVSSCANYASSTRTTLWYGPLNYSGATHLASDADASFATPGIGLAAAGDVNSDGYDDIWMGHDSVWLFHGTPR